ncbi:hypothetical protein Glove_421g142 [Diversispora epigaea]|uniref:Uncharacterized protein n=1 Tax=Diversispora epigaea TaxID=1348612 RepID=A0A397GXC4_9GLOM|nr:hypothetical protein Glove_421g142 [Diversispora epigaea]
MSNLNALFSTNSKASESRASANRVSTFTSRAFTSTAIPFCLISQSSGSSIQSFESDDSITPLSSVSNVRARSDDVLLLRRILTKIELLQKINENNQKKLCKLGEDMKSIKEKISVLSFNKESLDVIIKKSSEEFIEHSIYPIPGDYKEMAKNNLSTKVKASIFKIFDKLLPINSNATAAEITAWKRSPIVLECYKKLFTEIENTSEKYIVRIIKNAWPKKEFIPNFHTAWCVSIAEILLNPNNEYIQITEDVIQPFVEKNLVRMSNLNALFSTNSKASGSRASANRVSTSTSRASASTAIPPRLISQSSGSSIQSFESDDSITPLSSVSNVRARSDDVLLLRRILTKIELLQKINENNQKKLCKLGEDMKSIKEKISVLSFNKESLDVIIKKSSEEFIEHSIYPIPGDYKEMAKNNLSTKVKASIFKIFDKLLPINSNATAAEITAWKRSPIVLECYKKLFTEIENTSEKYIVRIIKNAWPKKEFIPNFHTAWCVSIAEILLNPNNEYIQITEDVIQPFVEKNLKKIENKIGFNNDSDSEEIAETFERKRKNQMNDDTELPTLGETQARLEKVINKKKMKQTVTLRKSQKKDDNGDDDDDYNNNNNNDYNNDNYNNNNNNYNNYNNNNNNYNNYNNNNVNNEDDFQIIEDDR